MHALKEREGLTCTLWKERRGSHARSEWKGGAHWQIALQVRHEMVTTRMTTREIHNRAHPNQMCPSGEKIHHGPEHLLQKCKISIIITKNCPLSHLKAPDFHSFDSESEPSIA